MTETDTDGAAAVENGDAPDGDGEITDSADEPVLELSDVGHTFGELTVLDGVDLSLERGHVTALVGPNGSGKTTLATIIAGLRTQTTGTRTLESTGERPIGYLPQEPRFRGALTVRETLRFYGETLAEDVDVDAAVERVGLAEADTRRTDELSGGMRRLLGLAIGMLGDPGLVVLDEPTSGLDPQMTSHIFDVVRDLADAGAAVLLTSHDLSWAAETDRVLVLDRGHIVRRGPPTELVEEAGTDTLSAAFRETVQTDPTAQAGTEDGT